MPTACQSTGSSFCARGQALPIGSCSRAEPWECSGLGGENSPLLVHPPLSHPIPASLHQPHHRQARSLLLTLQAMWEARTSVAHEVLPALGCRLAQPCTPARCSESTSSRRSFPRALPVPCSESLPRTSHVSSCATPAPPPAPPPQKDLSAGLDVCSVAQLCRTPAPARQRGHQEQGSGAFCRAKQSAGSIYLLLTIACSSEEHAFKRSEAPPGLSAELPVPSLPAPGCAGSRSPSASPRRLR